DQEAARKDFELWQQIYPRDVQAPAGLAVVEAYCGHWDQFLALTRKRTNWATRRNPSRIWSSRIYTSTGWTRRRRWHGKGPKCGTRPFITLVCTRLLFCSAMSRACIGKPLTSWASPGGPTIYSRWSPTLLRIAGNTLRHGS